MFVPFLAAPLMRPYLQGRDWRRTAERDSCFSAFGTCLFGAWLRWGAEGHLECAPSGFLVPLMSFLFGPAGNARRHQRIGPAREHRKARPSRITASAGALATAMKASLPILKRSALCRPAFPVFWLAEYHGSVFDPWSEPRLSLLAEPSQAVSTLSGLNSLPGTFSDLCRAALDGAKFGPGSRLQPKSVQRHGSPNSPERPRRTREPAFNGRARPARYVSAALATQYTPPTLQSARAIMPAMPIVGTNLE